MKDDETSSEDIEKICKIFGIPTEWLEKRPDEPPLPLFDRLYFKYLDLDPLQRILFVNALREKIKDGELTPD